MDRLCAHTVKCVVVGTRHQYMLDDGCCLLTFQAYVQTGVSGYAHNG